VGLHTIVVHESAQAEHDEAVALRRALGAYSARMAMVYDPSTSEVIMFGRAGSDSFYDTWAYTP
jgi:hypothetical protein